MHVKGYAAPETKAAAERARLLIEQAEAIGEPPEDPLLLFSVRYSFWVANLFTLMSNSLLVTGDIAESRTHFNQALALYDPAKHRPLATRFGQDVGAVILFFRSWTLWLLGYSEAALADADRGLEGARGSGQAASLMAALTFTTSTRIFCGSYATASAQSEEVVALADEKGTLFWRPLGMVNQGSVLALTSKTTHAVQMITSVISGYRSTGSKWHVPLWLSYLARAYAEIDQLDDAWRCIGEAITAIKTTNEGSWEAEVHRIAGEIARLSPQPDAAKAEAYFQRALTVARAQQAKSWELRAAMSLARLRRDQGKRDEARICSLRTTAGSRKASTRST